MKAARWRELTEQKAFRGKLWVAFGMEQCANRQIDNGNTLKLTAGLGEHAPKDRRLTTTRPDQRASGQHRRASESP